jgi:hypothetical protein
VQLVSSCTQIDPGVILAPAMRASLVLMTLFYDFRRDHVGSACSELKLVINQIASNSDAHTVRVVLLGTMVDHNVGLCDCSIVWDGANVSMQEKKDGISAFGNARTSLR